jgi:GH15 family glucan-1,4-alpha-glucosidase
LRAKKVNIRCVFSPPQGIDDTPIVGLDQRRASGGDEIMGYKPIESYGVIGDLHTVALVGIDGSIDWCCLPHFDSPSVFAAILDDQKGGSFRIASLYEAQHKQMYMPDSNVLVTFLATRASVRSWTSCRSKARARSERSTRSSG